MKRKRWWLSAKEHCAKRAKSFDDLKKPVEEKVDELKKLLENKDAKLEDIKQATEELSQEIQKIGAEMYRNVTPKTSRKTTGKSSRQK